MNIDTLLDLLVGNTISKVERHPDADSGLLITFENGATLEYGYSGGEGYTKSNGERIPQLD